MIGKMPVDQGRARGLYDEQLQRKQQEKALGLRSAGPPKAERPLFGLNAQDVSRLTERAS